MNPSYYPQYNRVPPVQVPQYMESMAQPQPSQFIGLKGRPVSSLEEARATSIDFDGSVFYFPDLANRRIYTKQINMDGTATLNVYEFKELPDPTTQNYITREEFNNTIEQLRNALAQQQQVVTQQAVSANNF